jgi:hypothetical protein
VTGHFYLTLPYFLSTAHILFTLSLQHVYALVT